MRTSRPHEPAARAGARRRALEASGLTLLLVLAPELARARLGAGFEPHPGWIAVLLLAARDGTGGLLVGLLVGGVALGLGSALGGGGVLAPYARFSTGPELLAFGTCLFVSWVASWHRRREADLRRRLRAASDRVSELDATNGILREAVTTLRARVDRVSTSLSFLRDVATRLEGDDPVAAAEAAADLALARTGASAAAVRVGGSANGRVLAVRDARRPGLLSPLSLRDAELTVPIRSDGVAVGVLALWGVPPAAQDESTTCDLLLVAAWCAPALASRVARPRVIPGREWSAG